MKVLVTGCNGQLGHEMRNILEKEMPGKTIYTDIKELDLTDGDAVKSFVEKNEITHIVTSPTLQALPEPKSYTFPPIMCLTAKPIVPTAKATR